MDQGFATVLAALIGATAAIVVALVTGHSKHRDVAGPPEAYKRTDPAFAIVDSDQVSGLRSGANPLTAVLSAVLGPVPAFVGA